MNDLTATSVLSSLPILFSLALTFLLLAATFFDVTQFRIPNLIPLLVTGLFLLKVGAGVEVGPFWPNFFIFVCTLVLGFLAFAAGVLGGGDVKLMAALALWLGVSAFADFIAITGVIGGLIGIVLILARRFIAIAPLPESATISSLSLKDRLLNPASPLPYALPISIAALWLEWYYLIPLCIGL